MTSNKYHFNNALDLQLALIRIYIGIDFIHHFAEKFGLLGASAYHGVSHYFASLGLGTGFVILAGLCEFAAFIGFTFGLFTRIAAIGTALYLIISLFSGFHYLAGFTWADHANNIMIHGSLQSVYGGWEYPLLWAFICLSFVLTGGRKWSIDAKIRANTKNKALQFLCK
ncbi:DoxX family protein [Cysteiniphilum halobium]|uniref:DoxX family protein n=1 Tax=Cysteiniphilum halobium TaxID=2219059 RepID=UPI003F8419D7